MNRKTWRVAVAIFIFTISNFVAQEKVAIIPQPNKIEIINAKPFVLDNKATISSFQKSLTIANRLQEILESDHQLSLKIEKVNSKKSINFKEDATLGKEAYQLDVNKDQITIIASGTTGWFYGMQSLLQIISPNGEILALKIEDEPRFGWRAYMLDESRYFQGEEFVKLILDEMAMLKMNVFHWHLVDDAGWRVEIKKYSKLTSVGGYRKDSQIGKEKWKSNEFSGEAHGGFYSQKQIKEIVSYAKERHITIVPEIEMPGHSSAAIAAYSWLGTTGEKIEVPVKFGRHYDNYDVTNPKTIQFIKDVLSEIFELFPSKVIHIGGDEVGYKVWEESQDVRQYMKDNELKTSADLQIYFTNNISKFIEQNGKRMMGWNEIMGINVHKGFEEKKNDKEAETALASNVVVHFWKGDIKLISQAAEQGYDIINSLHSNTYLDYDYETISLKKAYEFDPIPEGLDKKYQKNIYGLGCQMWTEWTPRNKDVAFQTFPRIAAYAEVGWTQLSEKNYDSFKIALSKMQYRWDLVGINYAKEIK